MSVTAFVNQDPMFLLNARAPLNALLMLVIKPAATGQALMSLLKFEQFIKQLINEVDDNTRGVSVDSAEKVNSGNCAN